MKRVKKDIKRELEKYLKEQLEKIKMIENDRKSVRQ